MVMVMIKSLLSLSNSFKQRMQEIRKGLQTVMVCYSQQLIADGYDSNNESDRLSPSLCQSSLLAAGQ